MRKTLLFVILFQFFFLSSFAQINNLSVFLATSEMPVEDLIQELQYKWVFLKPTEEVKEEIVEATYTFNVSYKGFSQVLERKELVNKEYGIRMKTTSLLFNDKELLERIRENLPYQGFQLKNTDFNQSLYKNGYHTIILKEEVSQDGILTEGFYKLEIYSYREELINLLLKKKAPDVIPDDATNAALNKILNGTTEQKNEVNNGVITVENPKNSSQSYYGSGIGITDNIYRLPGRRILVKQKPSRECKEGGIVVVEIEVDQNGNVLEATAGVKGTTSKSLCLLEKAKDAALATKFKKDLNAPAKQVGSIYYSFKWEE